MTPTSPALAALVALALAFSLGAGCSSAPKAAPPPPPPREIDVLTMAPTEVRDTSEYLGSLLSRGSVLVLPQVAGYVRKIHVRPGQRVDAGAVLVEVDAREENAALASASAQAESAQAALALATQSRSRAEALHREGLASGQELDQRRADVAAAEAAVRAAGANVSQRRVALSNHVIRAPVPGVIGDVQVRLGDYVTPTARLTVIAEADALELTVSVPAARARGLQIGAPIELLGEDGAVLVPSTVFYIAPEADARTQLVEVKAAFANKVGLRPSELVRARVVYSSAAALQVPLLALIRQSGQAFVLAVVERDGQLIVERRPIKLGPLGERGYLVEGGLVAGDRIAISSLQSLRDGAAVTIKPPGGPATATTPPATTPPATPPPTTAGAR